MNRRKNKALACASATAAFIVPVFLAPTTNANYSTTQRGEIIITITNDAGVWPAEPKIQPEVKAATEPSDLETQPVSSSEPKPAPAPELTSEPQPATQPSAEPTADEQEIKLEQDTNTPTEETVEDE